MPEGPKPSAVVEIPHQGASQLVMSCIEPLAAVFVIFGILAIIAAGPGIWNVLYTLISAGVAAALWVARSGTTSAYVVDRSKGTISYRRKFLGKEHSSPVGRVADMLVVAVRPQSMRRWWGYFPVLVLSSGKTIDIGSPVIGNPEAASALAEKFAVRLGVPHLPYEQGCLLKVRKDKAGKTEVRYEKPGFMTLSLPPP